MKKLMLDPGHGGRDPGAIGHGGLEEKRVVLDLCEEIRDRLRGVMQVSMTRHGDEFVELGQRATLANIDEADYFVSIHCNAAENRGARGFEVWTSPGKTGADPLATEIFRAMECSDPSAPARKDLGDGDVDKEARFTVLVKTEMPAVLVEVGFLTNYMDESMLGDDYELSRIAGAITEGILKHAGLGAPARESEKRCDTLLADLSTRIEILENHIKTISE